jgi:hypothetical protein
MQASSAAACCGVRRGGRQRDHRRHRIALVRHGRGAAAAIAGRFGQFGDFALRHQGQVGGDLAQAAGQHRHFEAEAHPFVALGVPGGVGHPGQLGGHAPATAAPCSPITASVPTAPPSCSCSARAACARRRARAHQRRQPAGGLEAEAGHLGRLHQRARQHRRASMRSARSQQVAGQVAQAVVEQAQGLARDQHHGGVDHVLAGAAPVHVARRFLVVQRHRLGQFLHQRDGQAAGAAAGADQGGNVVQLGLADAGDGARRAGRIRPSAACARASAASKRNMPCTTAASSNTAIMSAWSGNCRRSIRSLRSLQFMASSYIIEERGFLLALHADVPAVLAVAGLAREEGGAARFRHLASGSPTAPGRRRPPGRRR